MKRRKLSYSKVVLRGLIVLPAYVSYVIRIIVDYVDNKVNLTTYKLLENLELNDVEVLDMGKNKNHFM